MAKFQASYRPCLGLEIKVLRGHDITLAPFQFWERPDPYVKLCITTAPNGKRKTTVKNNTKNPIWNETFQFYLDPSVRNHLQITLAESDKFTKDDGLETKTIDLSGLGLNESYQHTVVFNEKFENSKVDVELKVTDCTAPTDMRYSIELCDEEKAFVDKRKKKVFEAMRTILGREGPQNLDEVPTIAILGSGGGFRSMVYLSGAFCALKDMGLLDCAMYISGLSGSAWFVSMLYSHPKRPGIHPKKVRKELRDIIEKNWVAKLLFSPAWLLKHSIILQRKKDRGQPISFTDLYGYLMGDVFRRKREDAVPKLSDQQCVVKDGSVPFPVYSALHVKMDETSLDFSEWVEFTPYEIGIAKYGTFVKTEQFGNKFFCGKLLTSHKEPPIHFLEGIFGSAYALLPQLLLDKEKPFKFKEIRMTDADLRKELQIMIDSDELPTMDGTEESDNEDDQEDDARAREIDDGEERSFKAIFLKKLMEMFPFLKTRKGRAGLVHNFLRELQVPSGDQYTVKAKRLCMVDSGFVMGSPFPHFMITPQRAADIFLSFEISARDSDDGIPLFKELLRTEEWARKNNYKFPPINAEQQLKEYGVKEHYVFRCATDPSCPIVLHFVMVNVTFRKQKAPGVDRDTDEEKKYADFKIFDDPKKWYSTLRFRYPNLQFDRLADLAYFNTLLGEDVIKDAMAKGVVRKRWSLSKPRHPARGNTPGNVEPSI